jgi:hypothetical protein
MSLRVDRLYDRRVVWDGKLQNPESEEYKTLEWESSRAVSTGYRRVQQDKKLSVLSEALICKLHHNFFKGIFVSLCISWLNYLCTHQYTQQITE